MIAYILTRVEITRLMIYRAPIAVERGWWALPILLGSDRVVGVTDDTTQIYGTAGSVFDFSVERFTATCELWIYTKGRARSRRVLSTIKRSEPGTGDHTVLDCPMRAR